MIKYIFENLKINFVNEMDIFKTKINVKILMPILIALILCVIVFFYITQPVSLTVEIHQPLSTQNMATIEQLQKQISGIAGKTVIFGELTYIPEEVPKDPAWETVSVSVANYILALNDRTQITQFVNKENLSGVVVKISSPFSYFYERLWYSGN